MDNISQSRSRFLHIFPDEKVVTSFINLFEEVFPNSSTYVVYSKHERASVAVSDKVVFFNVRDRRFRNFLKHTQSYERVVLHSLPSERVFCALNHPQLIFIAWGADIYESLFQLRGYKLYIDEREQYRVRSGKIPVFIYRLFVSTRDWFFYSRKRRLLKRVTQMGAAECDYKLFLHYFPSFHISLLPGFGYYPIEDLIGKDNLGRTCVGNSIWVNNSPAPNGNHVAVFRLLRDLVSDQKVYVPVSYGDMRFIKYIDQKGEEILGPRFYPLKQYLPSSQYYSLFLDANAFVFGHLRQCGIGNIVMALYFGAKCFFFRGNPLYDYLKEKSFVIYSIEEDMTEVSIRTPLDDESRLRNREIVKSLYSRESIINQIRNCFDSK